jgi:hypothetical protein
MVHDVDFATGKVRWSKEVRNGVPAGPKHLKNSYASETPVTDGERVYFYFGSVGLFVFDMKGTPCGRSRSGRSRHGTDGAPRVAGSPPRSDLHRQRQRRPVVPGGVRQADRRRGLARESRGGHQLGDAVRLGARRPRGNRHVRLRQGALLRSDREAAVGVQGMSSISIPTPFERHGLLFISSGYVGDALRPAYAIRPGASGDISLKPARPTNAFIAWSAPTLAPYNPTPLVYGTTTTRCSIAASSRATTPDRQGDLRPPAHRGGRERLHDVAVGLQRQIFVMSEDGDTYVIQAGPSSRCSARTRSAR